MRNLGAFTALALLVASSFPFVAMAQDGSATTSNRDILLIKTAVVSSINDIEVPAKVKGFINELPFEEGDFVDANVTIAQLDTESIEYELAAAKIRKENAVRQADDNTPVEYAEASLRTATQEYETDRQLVRSGAVTRQELERKKLTKIQSQLQLDRSLAQKKIDAGAVALEDQSLVAVQALMNRHSITAPFSGEIIKIYNRAGEFVQEGETVVRLVDLSQVRVEGFVYSAEHNSHALLGKPVTVTLQMAQGETTSFSGTVKAVGLEYQIARDGSKYTVQAIVDNQKMGDQWLLHPNASVSMEIDLN